MTTTTDTPMIDALRDDIAKFELDIAEAERAIGAAVLDGDSPAAANKRADAARSAIRAAEAAIEELERRAAIDAEERAGGAASARRERIYRWISRYEGQYAALLEARTAAKVAEDALMGEIKAPAAREIARAFDGFGPHADPTESDLDAEVLDRLPPWSAEANKKARGFAGAQAVGPDELGDRLERLHESAALAGQRADAEASGDGLDFSGVPSERGKAKIARRDAALARIEARRQGGKAA